MISVQFAVTYIENLPIDAQGVAFPVYPGTGTTWYTEKYHGEKKKVSAGGPRPCLPVVQSVS